MADREALAWMRPCLKFVHECDSNIFEGDAAALRVRQELVAHLWEQIH